MVAHRSEGMMRGIAVLLLAAGLLLGSGCNGLPGDQPLQNTLEEYFRSHQPSTGQDFVRWATTTLKGDSPRAVMTGLRVLAQESAAAGHPNMVGVASSAASAWARTHGLPYDPSEWVAWQDQAVGNIHQPPKDLKLFP